jgi:hypothetical protein
MEKNPTLQINAMCNFLLSFLLSQTVGEKLQFSFFVLYTEKIEKRRRLGIVRRILSRPKIRKVWSSGFRRAV